MYAYKCKKCGKEDSYFLQRATSIREADEIICECGTKMERQFSTAHINMRGTRGITSRTDVEISTQNINESINEFANDK